MLHSFNFELHKRQRNQISHHLFEMNFFRNAKSQSVQKKLVEWIQGVLLAKLELSRKNGRKYNKIEPTPL